MSSMVENPSTVLFLVNDDLRAIRVSYEDDGRSKQTIKKTFLTDLKVGDYVLVETETRWGATVCKVAALNVEPDFSSSTPVGWVFAKINLEELNRLKEEEQRALTIIMEARKREAKETLRKTILAQCGDELKALPSYSVKDAG